MTTQNCETCVELHSDVMVDTAGDVWWTQYSLEKLDGIYRLSKRVSGQQVHRCDDETRKSIEQEGSRSEYVSSGLELAQRWCLLLDEEETLDSINLDEVRNALRTFTPDW